MKARKRAAAEGFGRACTGSNLGVGTFGWSRMKSERFSFRHDRAQQRSARLVNARVGRVECTILQQYYT
jgi:hypothetical protein